jgi:hypothetical protein
MTPLDLTAQSPRSAHVEIDGICYLARAIDKIRAQQPGGNIGPYVLVREDVPTMQSMFYHRLAIAHDDFTKAVASEETDAGVAAWVRAHTSDERIAKWNRQTLNTKLSDLPPEALARVRNVHPCASGMQPETLLVDVFDADDAAMFAS